MKILHIGKYYPPFLGGVEKVSFDIVDSINKLGYSADVLCFNDNNKSVVESKDLYTIYRVSTFITKLSSPISCSIFKIIRQIYMNYDIIHLHLPNPMAAIALQSVPFKGKLILHWHSDIVKQKTAKFFYKPFQLSILKRADKIIVTSPNYLDHSDDLQKFRDKCIVIPIGIDNDDFVENIDFQSFLKEEYKYKKVIFSLGRLTYYKGFKYLIESASLLSDDYIILIGGVGELYETLWKQIKSNNLGDKVKLLGEIPFQQLGEYYKMADVFCLPSITKAEAFGVVIIEALSFGKPIIATNIIGSGVPWVSLDKITGRTVNIMDSKALSQSIIEVTNDENLMKLYGDNALKRYIENFSKNVMVDRIVKLYENILN